MKKKLGTRIKEALRKYSLFKKMEEVADRRRHGFHKRVAELEGRVASQVGLIKELKAAKAPNRDRVEDEEQMLFLYEDKLRKERRKLQFWRKKAHYAHERNNHWGTVLKHRRDRLRRWIQQHQSFQPYMANGNPYEKLSAEAKYGIYLDFRRGLYVTSTYEGYPGDGVHSSSSYHYVQNSPDGKARCWDAGAGTLGPMEAAQTAEAERCAAFLMEMFGPINGLEYKNGVRFTLPEGDPLETMHDNHKHTAIRDGAPTS